MRITAVTCVKNEGPFQLEWIAFNRLLGVTDFLFYSNDCSDGTDALLDAMAEYGVRRLPNPARGRNYQMEALKAAAHEDIVRQADWVWIADVDEFLNIHTGDHTLPALIDACGNPQAISVSFQFFANGGVERFEDRPVIEQFTRTHNPDLWCDQSAIEVKTLVRRDFPLQYFGAHRPFVAWRKGAPVWTDGSGRPVSDKYLKADNPRRIRRFPAQGARDLATLNHYALRSLDSYLVKNDRGDVNRENRAFDDGYWRDRNDCAWQDESILRYLPALRAALQQMQADPAIAALHQACVQSHRARARALRALPDYADLADRLRKAPPYPAAEWALMQKLGLVS